MINLIKLELKKFKIKGNVLGAAICNVCILGFLCLIFFVERSESNTIFDNYEMVFRIMSTFINATFIIFAGFLISKFIIEEYKTKTINLLFTYPINRKKLIISKVIIVSVFTFSSIVLSSVLIFSGFYFIQSVTHTTIGELSFKFISQQFIFSIITALTTSITALVPLYFGLRKKSVPVTMIASFLIVCLLYSGNGEFTLSSIIAIPIAFMLVGLSIVYLTIRDIESKDI